MKKPGLFAPRGAKQLYRALQAQDIAALERVRATRPDLAVAASTLIAVVAFTRGDYGAAREPLEFVFESDTNPAKDAFISRHTSLRIPFAFAEGITAQLSVTRTSVGLALADVYQRDDDMDAAMGVVEQLRRTAFTKLSLAEMYCDVEEWPEVVRVTEGVSNDDDATAMLCVFRGVSFREQGLYEAARQSFKEALRTKKRSRAVRHRALLERARTHEREGKRALARKDLERIMAEDSNYKGLDQALAELY